VSATAVPTELERLASLCAGRFGDNLRAVLWHGSRARGEAGPDSDDDLVIRFRAVDDAVLHGLREVFQSVPGRWSSYPISDPELAQLPGSQRCRLAFGHRAVYGEADPIEPSREDTVDFLRWHAVPVYERCRDRLINQASSRATAYRMAKVAVFALSGRQFYHHGHYPLTRAELLPLIEDSDERAIVGWVDRWPEIAAQLERDLTPVFLHLDRFARGLLASLPDVEHTGAIAPQPLRAPAPVPDALRSAIERCAERFGPRLRGVLWHRADAGWAEYDCTVVLDAVDDEALLALRGLLGMPPPSTVRVTSEAELAKRAPDAGLLLGAEPLNSAFAPPPASRESLLDDLRVLAREVLFHARQRLLHKESKVRMLGVQARNAAAAMQVRHLLEHGALPRLSEDLATTPEERAVIDWAARWQDWRPRLKRDPDPALLQLDAFARRLVASLPAR
jgi:hypothetical protein